VERCSKSAFELGGYFAAGVLTPDLLGMAITDNPFWARMSTWFRIRRNKALSEMIAAFPTPPTILDVGGHAAFWKTIPAVGMAGHITVLNSEVGEHSSISEMSLSSLPENMSVIRGDALALQFEDQAIDLVVCNSVLEHVGGWKNAQLAAKELTRVGRKGWVQVPAYEFPLEIHYMRPFVHWLSEPAREAALRASVKRFRSMSSDEFRAMFDYVQLPTRKQMRRLFPNANYRTERFLGLLKSHIVTW
jgi:ubiquinone/menaquinone biosynthesis C-methylase UbiE